MFKLEIYNKTKPHKHYYVSEEPYFFSYIGDQNVEVKWDYKNNRSITLNHV